MIADKDLLSIQQARILAENAHEAQVELRSFTQERLDYIVGRVADEVQKHTESLARMSFEETDCGNWQDKCRKNDFACTQVRDHIESMRCVGIINRDESRKIMEVGVPVGVVAALCPVTSPVSTTIYKTLIAIKSGNAIVFSPHPRALRSMSRVLDIMREAAIAAGLPENALSYMHTVTKSGTLELINHRHVGMVLISGVPNIYKEALCGGKPIIFGGMGNGPAFIERTANIDEAVRNIIASKTFDNGLAPSAEQSVVIDAPISGEVKAAFLKYGAYYINEKESEQLAALFFHPDGSLKKDSVGLDAPTLARRAGIYVPDNITIFLAERKYVSDSDPYSKGFLAPILACYIEDDWLEACEKCIELLLFERKAHILVIHSNDDNVIEQFALRKPVARMLVNTPASYGAMGITTNLFPAMTLGSGSAGHGITADNVSPMNLIYIRKVGYGIKSIDAAPRPSADAVPAQPIPPINADTLQTLQRLLLEIFESSNKNHAK